FYSIIIIFINYLQYSHCQEYTNQNLTTNLKLLMHQLGLLVVKFCLIGEANQVISLVESMKLIFFQICSSEDFCVSILVVEDLYESLLVNT
ncbi:hypothetical protein IGI04_018802, partial [Brassica rapa subsp. trilocularis]